MKTCAKCKTPKDLNSFNLARKRKDGRNPYCKECRRTERQSTRYQDYLKKYTRCVLEKNPQYNRQVLVKSKYGLTLDQIEDIFTLQGRKCLICGVTDIPSDKWAVDHDHSTGEVRGILCKKCNSGIGFLGDSIDTILNAYNYLARFKSPDAKREADCR